MGSKRSKRLARLVTGVGVAGFFGGLSCAAPTDQAGSAPTLSEESQAIVVLPIVFDGCADGSVEQVFGGGIVGCAGSVTYPNRASLCGVGYHPVNAMTWQSAHGATVPTHHYWTADVLGFTGTGAGSCAAQYSSGNACPTDQPMHVCASTTTDPEGNHCNWFDCAFDTSGTTPNDHFGGCAGNTTAGTLCVPNSGCVDGTTEQTFTHGMVGCSGSVTLANAATLCTAGYTLAYDSDWLRYRNGAGPTHDYWVATAPQHFSGSASACIATTNTSDPSCTADSPMRVCVSGGSDAEGNHCNWSNCGSSSSYSTTSNEYFGGCIGNTTAGALCVPAHGCADGTIEQQWNRFLVGCAGSVSWDNRESLCGPRELAVNTSEWTLLRGNLAPTHHYWTSELLLYSGSGTSNCSVSTTTGASCGTDDPMHICSPAGTDAEGNHCNWTHCGLNTTTPDQFFGGCGATAGTACITGP